MNIKQKVRKKIQQTNKATRQQGKQLLTTRQTTEIRNAFVNKMSTDIKLSKTQICKTI